MLPLHAIVEVKPGINLQIGFLLKEMYVEVVGYKNTSSTSHVINKKYYRLKKTIKTILANSSGNIDTDITSLFITIDSLGAKLLTHFELNEFKDSMQATIYRALEMKHRQEN